ncbi:MAG: hypothetical protein H6737_11295 [Alphaproteobacteria bacterium]|nr:hypothetical protein [Alphaproteobacteria bacterium]
MRALLVLLALAGCKRDPSKVDADGDGVFADVDCDDDDPSVFPGVIEQIYDGIDNDCDPSTPDDDLDGDGFVVAEDCQDLDAAISPGAEEDPYNGLDDDCDPSTPDDDLDGDGYRRGPDCADGNADIHPGQEEIYYDGLDNDCDPILTIDDDQDRDQVPVDVDCDDLDPLARAPGLYFVDCDLDGFAADTVGGVEACELPAAPTACPDGTWTLVAPVGPANDPANTTVDCSDADPDAWPGQTAFFDVPVADGPAAYPYDFDCDGTDEGLYGDWTCATMPTMVPGEYFCSSVPGFLTPTACGAAGEYISGCTVIDPTTCDVGSTETRTQECR